MIENRMLDAPIPSRSEDWLLQAEGLAKSFPGVQALQGVRLAVAQGRVHAVLGENGAGKSTLMRLLTGEEQPDQGVIRLRGQTVVIRNPHHALTLGIAMIHQELQVFPALTVTENLFMGREPQRGILGWIDRARMMTEARRLLQLLNIPVSPLARMGDLSVAQMQGVEIAKALSVQAGLVIMDEPTSALSEPEVSALFRIIADLKQQGTAILYVSHKLDEIFRIADTVTVLRDGRHIATRNISELNPEKLIDLMAGRELNLAGARPVLGVRPDNKPSPPSPKPAAALSARELTRQGAYTDISFDVHPGEILGLAGLMGAGRTELVSALYGLCPADRGSVFINGQPVKIRSPREGMALGIAMVTEDRRGQGLVLPMSVKHNLTLANLKRYCWGPFILANHENRLADAQIRAYRIKARDRNQKVEHLSGGNQQKIVLAKALLGEPKVLILDEPTRGIDIGTKSELYPWIRQLARSGLAVILVSSELPEILALSDRIMVLRQGRLSAELDPRQTTQEEILKFAMPT